MQIRADSKGKVALDDIAVRNIQPTVVRTVTFSLYSALIYMSLIRNTADKIQKGTQNTRHNDENCLKLKGGAKDIEGVPKSPYFFV